MDLRQPDQPESTPSDTPDLHRLIERHLPELREYVGLNLNGLVRSQEAPSDILQSAVREALSHAGRFEYRGEAQFRAWLCSIATRKILEKHRHYTAQRRDVRRAAPLDGELVPEHEPREERLASPSAVAEHADDLETLRRAFEELDEDERLVLSMRRIFGLPAEQIAAELGISPRTVGSRLAQAQARLAASFARRQARG